MEQEIFEQMTGVTLQQLLEFNERRLDRIAAHVPGNEDYRRFVQGRIESLKAQIAQTFATVVNLPR